MNVGDVSKKVSYEQYGLEMPKMSLRTTVEEREKEGENEGAEEVTVVLLEEPSEKNAALGEVGVAGTAEATEDPELKIIPSNAVRDDGNEDPDADHIPQELGTRSFEMPRDGSQTDGKEASFLIDALKEFAGSTTMHGAPKIILARSPVKLIVWLLVFFGCWVTFIYQTILVCDNYLKYPKKIDLDIREGPVPYPAITFCNERGVSFFDSETWGLGKRHYRNKYLYGSIPMVAAEFRSPEIVEIIENSAIPKEEFFVEVHTEYKADNGDAESEMTNDIFRYLEEVWSDGMFKCYTLTLPEFYKQYRIRTIRGAVMAGRGMMSFQKDYIWQQLSDRKDNLRIYIHPAETRIYPRFHDFDEYHEVEPGKHAKLHIKFKNTVRVGQPHGNCTNENPFLQNNTENVYIRSECLELCRSSQFLKQTGKVNIHLLPLDNMNCLDDEEVEDWMEDLVSICYTYTPGVFTNEKTLNRSAEGWVCWSHLERYENVCYKLANGTLTEGELPVKHFTNCVNCVEKESMEKICTNREEKLRTIVNKHRLDKRFCNISTPATGGETIVRTFPTTARYDGFEFIEKDCGCYPPCNDITYDVLQVDSEQPSLKMNHIFGEKLWIPLGNVIVDTNYSGRFRSNIKRSNIRVWVSDELNDLPENAVVELPEIDDDKFFFINSYIQNNKKKALKDLATFEILFPDYSIPTVIESPLYTPTQLISEIGGQLGIWIGVSVITLSEVIEFLISVLCEMHQRRKKQEREMKKEETGEVDQH